MLPSLFMSPKKTSASESIIEHSLATEIAVSTLSPVAIIVRMLASFNVSITPVVAGLSLFYIIRNPKN